MANVNAQERLIEARYEDGVSEVFEGGADPVQVSMIVFDQDGGIPNDAGLSTLFTTWGQFMDHDMVLSPEDHDAGVLNLVGMPHDIARSAVADSIADGQTIAPTNVVTWQIDASQVYGSTQAREEDLRAFEGGKLRMQDDVTSASQMLPDADADSFMAGDISGDNPVYLAGDVRANENPNLLSLHTIFVREHNYWAERLAQENPDWTDDQLYDAARSIVEYEIQDITYTEWLPHLIGDAADTVGDLGPDPVGEVSVEFSTAAFRFGHTLVSSQIDLLNDDGTDAGSMALMDAFFNHSPVEDSGIEAVVRGQLDATAQQLDTQIVDDLNFFLQTPDGVSGFSLAALNLARGLDHGLESYVEVRAALIGDIDPATLDPADFSIITSDADTAARLAAAYTDIFQVDLWVGGLAEDAIEGTQLGPLFTHIVADQFARTRAADDTFGTLDPALGQDIIAAVKASDFATIITRTTDVDMVQDDVFLAQSRALSVAEDIITTQGTDIISLAAQILDAPLNTRGGDDVLILTGGSTITGAVQLRVGDDTLIATSGIISGPVSTNRGDDTVDLSGTANLTDTLKLQAGNDTVALSDMATADRIITGGGDDAVTLTGRATATSIITGRDDDSVTLSGRAMAASIATGRGNDVVTLTDSSTVSGAIKTARGDDTVTLAGTAKVDKIATGGNDDTITLGENTTVTGAVNAGRGDDTITLASGANIGRITGGAGDDTLILKGPTRVEYDANPNNGTVFYLDENGADTGETVVFRSIENVTCFTRGTRIRTETGDVAIETLSVGDRVWTMDSGHKPIAWIGEVTVAAQGKVAPIRIAKGALNNDRDLWVSPQHRMLLNGWKVELHCGEDQVLVPAKDLVNDTTIRPQIGGRVTYLHIAFDRHEIVMAEGIPSESFYPGAVALTALDVAARDEILTLFPHWSDAARRPKIARTVVSPQEAAVLRAATATAPTRPDWQSR